MREAIITYPRLTYMLQKYMQYDDMKEGEALELVYNIHFKGQTAKKQPKKIVCKSVMGMQAPW